MAHSFPMHPSLPPENIRKTFGFLFSGRQIKGALGTNGLSWLSQKILRCFFKSAETIQNLCFLVAKDGWKKKKFIALWKKNLYWNKVISNIRNKVLFIPCSFSFTWSLARSYLRSLYPYPLSLIVTWSYL